MLKNFLNLRGINYRLQTKQGYIPIKKGVNLLDDDIIKDSMSLFEEIAQEDKPEVEEVIKETPIVVTIKKEEKVEEVISNEPEVNKIVSVDDTEDVVEEIIEVVETGEELNKFKIESNLKSMTKKKIIEFANENNLESDISQKKSDLINMIINQM